VLTAFATQASIAIRNARLIEELARSRAVIERRAEAEQALREIATRITAIREPGDLLQRIVDEARRLLRADGAVIDEYDELEGVLVSAYDAGLTDEQRESVRATRLRLGEGLSGRAMLEAGSSPPRLPRRRVPARARNGRAGRADGDRRPDRGTDHRRRGAARCHRGLPP
jgi:GAF domain-containing protein